MIDLIKRIELINGLLQTNSAQSLTYAALECRLTIEQICYERLIHSHTYISRKDLRAWTPVKVVQQISEEANELIGSEFKISISNKPIKKGSEPKSLADYESLEYIELGKQSEIHFKEMGSLWQGLANVALHIHVPNNDEHISIYGNSEKIKGKISEAISQFQKIANGNLLSTSFSNDITFECLVCKYQIKRKENLLKQNQVISCFNYTCHESYLVNLGNDEVEFIPRKYEIICRECNTKTCFPSKQAEELKFGKKIDVSCINCGVKTSVTLIIVQESAK